MEPKASTISQLKLNLIKIPCAVKFCQTELILNSFRNSKRVKAKYFYFEFSKLKFFVSLSSLTLFHLSVGCFSLLVA